MLIRIFFLLCAALSLNAQAGEVYVIDNIKISANAKSANIARNNAVEKGQLKAFQELLKLHYPDAQSKFNSLDKENISATIESYELSEERRSTTNYLAKLKVTFNKKQVDELMQNMGANYVESSAQEQIIDDKNNHNPILAPTTEAMNSLIIPVLKQGDNYYWFDDENSWLNSWHKKLKASPNEKFILPIGDLEDLSILNKDLLNKNLIDLHSLLERYNANNIVLLTLDNNMPNLALRAQYLNKFFHNWQSHEFSNPEGDDINLLFAKYINEVEQYNFNSSGNKSAKLTEEFITVEAQTINIDYPIEKISDWSILEEILSKSKYVSNLSLHQVTLRNYNFSFKYNISFENLETLFKNNNFTLQPKGDNKFILVRAHEQH